MNLDLLPKAEILIIEGNFSYISLNLVPKISLSHKQIVPCLSYFWCNIFLSQDPVSELTCMELNIYPRSLAEVKSSLVNNVTGHSIPFVAKTLDIEHIIHAYYLRKIFGKNYISKANEVEQCPKIRGRRKVKEVVVNNNIHCNIDRFYKLIMIDQLKTSKKK